MLLLSSFQIEQQNLRYQALPMPNMMIYPVGSLLNIDTNKMQQHASLNMRANKVLLLESAMYVNIIHLN